MAVVTRNQLKAWFKTFAKPLESQFHDWIDSFRHNGEKITFSDLDADLSQTISDLPNSAAIQQLLQEVQGKATLQQLQDLQQQVTALSGVLQPASMTISEAGSFIIPAGKLMHKIVAIADEANDVTFSVGYSDVTDELVEPTIIAAGASALFTCDHYKVIDYTIFFQVDAPVTIKIYLL